MSTEPAAEFAYPYQEEAAEPRSIDWSDHLVRGGAEFAGTFFLLFAGIGAALFANYFYQAPFVIPMAFGIAVLGGATALGHISGGHFNPAVTIGATLAGRMRWGLVPTYIIAQFLGALAGTALLFAALKSIGGDFLGKLTQGLGENFIEKLFQGTVNGYDKLSPWNFGLASAILIEAIATAIFVYVILGATDRRAKGGNAPAAIGLTLAVLLLVAIPVTNGGLNPARSFAVLPFAGDSGGWGQYWVFLLAPLLGAAIAGLLYPTVTGWFKSEEDALMDEMIEAELLSAYIEDEDEMAEAPVNVTVNETVISTTAPAAPAAPGSATAVPAVDVPEETPVAEEPAEAPAEAKAEDETDGESK